MALTPAAGHSWISSIELDALNRYLRASLLAACLALAAAWVVRRIGLLTTMVFTHLPSNVLLLLVPLMPTLGLAVAVLLLRFSNLAGGRADATVRHRGGRQSRRAICRVRRDGVAPSLGAAVPPALATALIRVPSLAGRSSWPGA
jgi:hypothetical protein